MKRGEFDILARAVQAASCSPCFSKGWTEQGPQKLSSQSWGHSTIITTSSSDKGTHWMAQLAGSPLLAPSLRLLSGGYSGLRLSWNTCPSGGGHHHHTAVLQRRWGSRPTSPKGFTSSTVPVCCTCFWFVFLSMLLLLLLQGGFNKCFLR